MTVKVTYGNIFNAQTDAIVNPVNCVGVMGAGLAKVFKQKFPSNFATYKQACDEGLQPGELIISEANGNTPRYIINLPTKDHWRDPSEWQYIQKGLVSLKEQSLDMGITSLAMPALGCGLGGLEFEMLVPMVKDIFLNVDFDILIFRPQ